MASNDPTGPHGHEGQQPPASRAAAALAGAAGAGQGPTLPADLLPLAAADEGLLRLLADLQAQAQAQEKEQAQAQGQAQGPSSAAFQDPGGPRPAESHAGGNPPGHGSSPSHSMMMTSQHAPGGHQPRLQARHPEAPVRLPGTRSAVGPADRSAIAAGRHSAARAIGGATVADAADSALIPSHVSGPRLHPLVLAAVLQQRVERQAVLVRALEQMVQGPARQSVGAPLPAWESSLQVLPALPLQPPLPVPTSLPTRLPLPLPQSDAGSQAMPFAAGLSVGASAGGAAGPPDGVPAHTQPLLLPEGKPGSLPPGQGGCPRSAPSQPAPHLRLRLRAQEPRQLLSSPPAGPASGAESAAEMTASGGSRPGAIARNPSQDTFALLASAGLSVGAAAASPQPSAVHLQPEVLANSSPPLSTAAAAADARRGLLGSLSTLGRRLEPLGLPHSSSWLSALDAGGRENQPLEMQLPLPGEWEAMAGAPPAAGGDAQEQHVYGAGFEGGMEAVLPQGSLQGSLYGRQMPDDSQLPSPHPHNTISGIVRSLSQRGMQQTAMQPSVFPVAGVQASPWNATAAAPLWPLQQGPSNSHGGPSEGAGGAGHLAVLQDLPLQAPNPRLSEATSATERSFAQPAIFVPGQGRSTVAATNAPSVVVTNAPSAMVTSAPSGAWRFSQLLEGAEDEPLAAQGFRIAVQQEGATVSSEQAAALASGHPDYASAAATMAAAEEAAAAAASVIRLHPAGSVIPAAQAVMRTSPTMGGSAGGTVPGAAMLAWQQLAGAAGDYGGLLGSAAPPSNPLSDVRSLLLGEGSYRASPKAVSGTASTHSAVQERSPGGGREGGEGGRGADGGEEMRGGRRKLGDGSPESDGGAGVAGERDAEEGNDAARMPHSSRYRLEDIPQHKRRRILKERLRRDRITLALKHLKASLPGEVAEQLADMASIIEAATEHIKTLKEELRKSKRRTGKEQRESTDQNS